MRLYVDQERPLPLLLCIFIGGISAPYFSLAPVMSVAGGIYLLFSGLEINLRQIGKESSVIGKLWIGGFVPPFLVGLILPYIFPHLFASPEGLDHHATAFIVGIALSVSAVPVVIKIIEEIGWRGTLRAQRVIFTAVLCDIAAWLLFFFVLPPEGHTSWLLTHWSLLMFFIGLALTAAWPALLGRISLFMKLNKWVIGSIFFIGIGQTLKLDMGINLAQIALIFVAATGSKLFGVWTAAKYLKFPREEAFALPLALNARGAMEVIMAKFALNAGVITSELFVSLVVMALGTSLIIKPILRWRQKRNFHT
ncbi:MAG: cation:proton antiporter [Bdellovibrionales bacterium]|nr:cation:proton antiporter [Bdellovibrionales bacterium]